VFQRRQVKTQKRLMAEELGESLGHLRMAASHAADGASTALAPRVKAARNVVKPRVETVKGVTSNGMDALFSAARDGSRRSKKMAKKGKAKVTRQESRTSRRWPLIGGLLAAGAAAGAASVLLRRRRAQRTWDEYGSTRTTGDTGSVLDSAKSTMDAGIDKASAIAESAKDRASDLIGSKSTNAGPGADYTKQPSPGPSVTPTPSPSSMGGDKLSSSSSKNSRP
jgi:hypothetical protein